MKWVIEFGIVGLFDNINHEKLLELIRKHCQAGAMASDQEVELTEDEIFHDRYYIVLS